MRNLLKKINRLLDKLLNYIFPPIKFKKSYFERDGKLPTKAELDMWAEEIEEKLNRQRRRKK